RLLRNLYGRAGVSARMGIPVFGRKFGNASDGIVLFFLTVGAGVLLDCFAIGGGLDRSGDNHACDCMERAELSRGGSILVQLVPWHARTCRVVYVPGEAVSAMVVCGRNLRRAVVSGEECGAVLRRGGAVVFLIS